MSLHLGTHTLLRVSHDILLVLFDDRGMERSRISDHNSVPSVNRSKKKKGPVSLVKLHLPHSK